MTLEYRESLTWLFNTQRFGIKLGLENSRRLFNALDVPQPNVRIIHVAGTNGKGSVCALLDSICRAAGYRTALFGKRQIVKQDQVSARHPRSDRKCADHHVAASDAEG